MVLVDFVVTAPGNAKRAPDATAQQELEAAGLEAVSQWKFNAGQIGGRRVNTHMEVPIRFTLGDVAGTVTPKP